MSIRIALDNAPEFYTNLDFIQGRIILGLNRPESIGNIVVKLEGDARTALDLDDRGNAVNNYSNSHFPSDYRSETHKLLYLLKQVYPDAAATSTPSTPVGGMPGVLYPGQHEFPFKFKMPLNNICGNPSAMAALSGIGGIGGPSGSANLLGFAGFRTMDGSKQLMLSHVRATLPPSLTGFPRKAEIRYYIKVTIQRPGFFKENWRYQIGFKFLPIESPRPPITKQEAFARRPFTFEPRTPEAVKKRTSIFNFQNNNKAQEEPSIPPSLEMSARLPYPSILTCNQPIPLRLVAKKLSPSKEQVYLTSLEIALLGFTDIRVFDARNTEATRWVVASGNNLAIPIGDPEDAVDTETVLPDRFWAERPLPNTVAPSFTTCNLSRRYEIELRITLTWGKPTKSGKATSPYPRQLTLPLKLSKVEIFSGITPPKELVQAAASSSGRPQPPPLPPRASTAPGPPHDPLYPPQLAPGEVPRYDDAPPSYDEAMAQQLTGPEERPAYSGVTAENDPSTMPPEKSGLH
ncbi:hypothetical protein E8E14_009266 [Neopestalotiopsis sp. 37M]|nr:hypothetical protein E8E14_009266 [Neopestalotiopsis sp. 37M]